MKLNDLYEAYCPACGGWDREQQGTGHKHSCPVGEAGTPIAQTEEPEIEEGHAIVAGEFDVSDVEEVYSYIKGYGGTIVKRGLPSWSRVAPFTAGGVPITVMFDDMDHAKLFHSNVIRLPRTIMTFSTLPVAMQDAFKTITDPGAATEAYDMLTDNITGKVDAKFVRDFDLS